MRPGQSLLTVLILLLLLSMGAFFSEQAALVWLLTSLFLLLPVILDALLLFLLSDTFQAKRELSPALSLGKSAKVRLVITRSGKGIAPARLRVFELCPPSMTAPEFPRIIERREWNGSLSIAIDYSVIPFERGNWEFPACEALFSSPLHFWRRKMVFPERSVGRTYPDFKDLFSRSPVDIRGVTERSGIKKVRRRGQGLEFESLREYQTGDPVRSIDWRATSRRGKVIVKEWAEDRDQQIVFLLDSGYRLHRRDGDFLQFDLALNAVLLLSWVALHREDSVAIASFGNQERWLKPRKGASSVNGLLNELYDVKSGPVPSSPFAALEMVLERVKKRSLIVLVSNFREEDGETLSWILPRVEERHLLLLVSIREGEAEVIAAEHPLTSEGALEKAAAFSYLEARRELYRLWERQGLLTLETTSANLSSDLINRYLDLKSSGRL